MHTIERPLLESAAGILTGETAGEATGGEAARQLLSYLGAFDGTGPGNLASLVRLASRLPTLFTLPVSRAPGLSFLGATVDARELGWRASGDGVAGVSGSGMSFQSAFAACMGEAAEYLSQLERGDEEPVRRRADEIDPERLLPNTDALVAQLEFPSNGTAPAIDWVAGERALAGSPILVPADLCLRGREHAAAQSRIPLSTGCAAGPTTAAASLSAVLELVERDAAALWWIGGRRGRHVAPESSAGRAFQTDLQTLRQGRSDRRTSVLDITTDLAIPCVVALSCNADGRDLAFGLAARLDLDGAVRSALVEMCQGELGNELIAVKLARGGETALSERERQRARRSRELVYGDCPLLHADGIDGPRHASVPGGDPLTHVLHRLAAAGVEVAFVDLTRLDVGIPVTKAFAPGLQIPQSPIAGNRLKYTLAEFGGGRGHTDGFALL